MLDLKYCPSSDFVNDIQANFDVLLPAFIKVTIAHNLLKIGDENVAVTSKDSESIEKEIEGAIKSIFRQKKRYDAVFDLLKS